MVLATVTNCYLLVGLKWHLGGTKNSIMLIIPVYFLLYLSCLCLLPFLDIHLFQAYALICVEHGQEIWKEKTRFTFELLSWFLFIQEFSNKLYEISPKTCLEVPVLLTPTIRGYSNVLVLQRLVHTLNFPPISKADCTVLHISDSGIKSFPGVQK